MGSRKGTVLRVSLAAITVAALAAAAVIVVKSGKFGGDDTAAPTQLAGANGLTGGSGGSAATGDGYGTRGDLFVATQDNRLHRFAKLGSGKQAQTVTVTGLTGGERIVGIDTRPANGQLYAVGSSSRLYVIDPATGVATQVGNPFATALAGQRFGVDFNPVVDRLRIVSDTGQNLRIDPTTGAVAGVDTNLNRAGVTAAAYTNSVAGATATALYDIDSRTDTLVLQGTAPGVTPVVSPNAGQLFAVGQLGIDVVDMDGFEIVGATGDLTAVAAVRIKGADDTRLVRIDLGSGQATTKGRLPGGVVGIAASAGAPRSIFATTARNSLVRFDRDGLRIRMERQLTGLAPGEKVMGIDVRPANGQLYLLGSTNQIYTVNAVTAEATAVGTPFSSEAYGNGVGFDVNPAADRLRVVTSTGQNLRLVPDTGAVAGADKPLAYAADDRNAGTQPNVTHAAYTNSRAGTTATTLYDVDTALDALVMQNPPNDGTLRTTGDLQLNVDKAGGFDIAADGAATAAFARNGGTRIYSVDLKTGQARLIGKLGRGSLLTSLTVAPRGV